MKNFCEECFFCVERVKGTLKMLFDGSLCYPSRTGVPGGRPPSLCIKSVKDLDKKVDNWKVST